MGLEDGGVGLVGEGVVADGGPLAERAGAEVEQALVALGGGLGVGLPALDLVGEAGAEVGGEAVGECHLQGVGAQGHGPAGGVEVDALEQGAGEGVVADLSGEHEADGLGAGVDEQAAAGLDDEGGLVGEGAVALPDPAGVAAEGEEPVGLEGGGGGVVDEDAVGGGGVVGGGEPGAVGEVAKGEVLAEGEACADEGGGGITGEGVTGAGGVEDEGGGGGGFVEFEAVAGVGA